LIDETDGAVAFVQTPETVGEKWETTAEQSATRRLIIIIRIL
jgi:hypothetical protein